MHYCPLEHVFIHIAVITCENPLSSCTSNFCLSSAPVISFLQLTPGGKAAQAGVGVGDWVVSIDDSNAEEMTHVEAQNKIRAASDSLTLTLSK